MKKIYYRFMSYVYVWIAHYQKSTHKWAYYLSISISYFDKAK